MVEIVLEGPGKNALGSQLMVQVRERLAAAGGAPVLLTGAGDALSAGLDLNEVGSLEPAGMEQFLRRLEDLVTALFHYPGPTVAAVNGHAIAGGAILALCCDHRVCTADPRARIGLNEVALGLRFPPRVLAMVRYRVPGPGLEQVLLGAGLHGPADALRLGLVDEIAQDPGSVARARLAALAAHPAEAYAATKRDLRGSIGRPDAEAERAFLAEVLPVWTSDALRARIRGFLERKR